MTTLKGADAGLYYVEALPSYYLYPTEAAGVWCGRGAAGLGLSDDVDDEPFLALMAGLDPETGEPLGRRYGEDSVRGFDVTASAPKSVSVLFGLGDDATRRAVLEAHDAAVGAMVGWIEEHAHTRYRIDGQIATVDARGIVAAAFRQHTSRALDPQLHTHVVIANRVVSPDDRWLALDARTIKVDQRTLSAVYHASLRAELTRSLGVPWNEPANRIAEISALPADVLAEFSSRTDDVRRRTEEKLERFAEAFERDPTPRERWRLEREAVADSRPAKAHGFDAASLHAEWAERCQAIGYQPAEVAEALAPARVPERVLDDATQQLVVERALEALGEMQSSWRPAELVRELAAAVPTDVTVPAEALVPWLDELAQVVIAERLVDLSRPVPDGVELRRDGRPLDESVLDRALTTPEILAQEERLLAWADRRLAASGHDLAVAGAGPLSGPQQEVAAALAGSRELVLVVGPAGTGKTTAVAPAVEQLREEGRAVLGVAPAAGAAEVLATDAHLSADTLDKLLVEHRLERRPDHRYDLPAGATVVVDEAAMVSTPKLAELATLADERGWRLALVGDPLQFSAVGRSGMFGHLVETRGAIELDDVHRFAHDWERQASLRLRRGDPDVLDVYAEHGRIHEGMRGRMAAAAVQAWWAARAQGETVAMMAPTTETVAELNRRAQARRARAGEIDLEGPCVAVGESRLYVGDIVATRHNDRRLRTDRGLMVKNRDQWELEAVHRGGAVTVGGKTGTVRLPAEYVAEHLELAYAQTSHASQGRTVDRSLLFLDCPTDTRGLYVPMTRGRVANEVFVAVEGEETARDVLAQALARSWIDEPAVARRAELERQPAASNGAGAEPPLGQAELRDLLERHHAIGQTLSDAEFKRDHFGERIENDDARRLELLHQIAEAEGRRDRALEIIQTYDGPLSRRIHRDEVAVAQRTLRQAEPTIERAMAEVQEIDQRRPGFEAAVTDGRAMLADRSRLERERHDIGRLLHKDRTARGAALAVEPPDYLVEHLGPRPQRGAGIDLWDEAAGRIAQHRAAFDISDDHDLLGPGLPWDRTAFDASHREATAAWEHLNQSLGRARSIEPPGLEIGIGF